MSRKQIHRSVRRGAHTVEMAIVLPIVFVLFLGGIEMARLQMIRHLVDNASYEAARHVIVPGATVAEAEKVANDIMKTVGITGAKVVVSPSPILETTKSVKVRVTIPAKYNVWTAATFSDQVSLGGDVSLMTERGPMTQVQAIVVPPPTPVTPPPSTTTTGTTTSTPPKTTTTTKPATTTTASNTTGSTTSSTAKPTTTTTPTTTTSTSTAKPSTTTPAATPPKTTTPTTTPTTTSTPKTTTSTSTTTTSTPTKTTTTTSSTPSTPPKISGL